MNISVPLQDEGAVLHAKQRQTVNVKPCSGIQGLLAFGAGEERVDVSIGEQLRPSHVVELDAHHSLQMINARGTGEFNLKRQVVLGIVVPVLDGRDAAREVVPRISIEPGQTAVDITMHHLGAQQERQTEHVQSASAVHLHPAAIGDDAILGHESHFHRTGAPDDAHLVLFGDEVVGEA